MDQQYQKQCTVFFDVAFDDIIKCVDVNLLDKYLNTVTPNPRSLSFMKAINCAKQYPRTTVINFVDIHRWGNALHENIIQEHIICCKKILNYGVEFEYDECGESIKCASNEIKNLLIKYWHDEKNHITNILMYFNPMIKFPLRVTSSTKRINC